MAESEVDTAWRERWARVVAEFPSRPAMYIGNVERAHLLAVQQALLLVWKAKVFRKPHMASVFLSPNQFAVIYKGGGLIRPVRQSLSVRDKFLLDQHWQAEMRPAADLLNPLNYRTWRYAMYGPIGPRLSSMWNAAIAAKSLAWGLRTDEGLWCQTFKDAWPAARSFEVDTPGIQLFVIAHLDTNHFKGLPFKSEDTAAVEKLCSRSFVSGGGQRKGFWRSYAYTKPDIHGAWHDQNDLIESDRLDQQDIADALSRLCAELKPRAQARVAR